MTGWNQPAGHLEGKDVRLYSHEDWAAVYVDGELMDGPGDRYLRIEYLLHGFGVEEYDTSAFNYDENGVETPARTVQVINDRIKHREFAAQTEARLRAQAADLLAQADEIASRAR